MLFNFTAENNKVYYPRDFQESLPPNKCYLNIEKRIKQKYDEAKVDINENETDLIAYVKRLFSVPI